MALSVWSPAFNDRTAIPTHYTCDGVDISPPLLWSGVPEGTDSLALIVYDPDAPDPKSPEHPWVHWVLYDLPPDSKGLPAGVGDDELPPGTRHGINDWGRPGWGGPCPPRGVHRYFFELYALDTTLGDLDEPTRDRLLEAMEGHIVIRARLIGLYQREM